MEHDSLSEGKSQDPQQSGEENSVLTRRLADLLQENKSLYERLAELDIKLNIEIVELKREIESLSYERDDLLKENEGLFSDLSSKEQMIQEFSRKAEINHLLLEETNRYLNVATERMREAESKYKDIKSGLEAIQGERAALVAEKDTQDGEIRALNERLEGLTASLDEKSKETCSLEERLSALDALLREKVQDLSESGGIASQEALASKDREIERLRELHESTVKEIRDEREGILGEKQTQIEDLLCQVQGLRDQNESLSSKETGLKREIIEARVRTKSLEDILFEKEKSLKQLEERISYLSDLGSREKEKLSAKLEEVLNEVSSLHESKRSLTEALREMEEETRILRAELESSLKEKENEIQRLKNEYDESLARIDTGKTSADEELREAKEKLTGMLREKGELEGALAEAHEKISSLADTMSGKDRVLSRLEKRLKETDEKVESLEQSLSGKDAALQEIEENLKEARRKTLSLEEALSIRETSLREMQERFFGRAELEHREKEELSARLREALNEVSSLNASYLSLMETLRKREEEGNLLKTEMEDALAGRDDEMRILTANLEEKMKGLRDENAACESAMREAKEKLTVMLRERGELERALAEADEKISILTDILFGKDRVLLGLEERLKETDEKVDSLEKILSEKESTLSTFMESLNKANERSVFLEHSLHEKDHVLAGTERELRDTRERLATLEDALSERTKAIAALNEELTAQKTDIDTLGREREDLFMRIQEIDSLREARNSLSEKISAAEEDLMREKEMRAELENALTLKDMELDALRARHESETKRLTEEKITLEADSARLLDKIRLLEDESRLNESVRAELVDKLAAYHKEIECRQSEEDKLAGDILRLENDINNLSETSAQKIKALEDTVKVKEHDAVISAQEAKGLEADLSEARREILRLEDAVSTKDISMEEIERKLKGYESLFEEKAMLESRLAATAKEADGLRDIRAFLSQEIGRLGEERRKLTDESETSRLAFKSDMEAAFARISENAGRLEHTISEGIHLAKKLEEISVSPVREDFPVAMRKPARASVQSTRKRFQKAAFALIAVLLLLGGISVILLQKENIYNALKQVKSEKRPIVNAAEMNPWAEGIKKIRTGEYNITLIFLNKEAVGVLGLSEKIPDTSMAEDRYALLEIKTEGGCIPEDFPSSWGKNVSFIDEKDATLPLNQPESLADEQKVIYKSRACGDKTGVVYIKGFFSVGKNLNIRGLAIRGLRKDSAIILK